MVGSSGPVLLLAVKPGRATFPTEPSGTAATSITLPQTYVCRGVRLDIEPGAVVKFGAYHFDLFVEGTLVANGTPAAPITFTEIHDDVGGRRQR